jgi:hypothetical protein
MLFDVQAARNSTNPLYVPTVFDDPFSFRPFPSMWSSVIPLGPPAQQTQQQVSGMEFKETSTFTRDIKALLSDDEFARLQANLVAHPEFGKLIQGSDGIRKVRWRLPGRGKSGGVRIIYYWARSADQILLLRVYAKSTKADLTPREISELRQIITDEYP